MVVKHTGSFRDLIVIRKVAITAGIFLITNPFLKEMFYYWIKSAVLHVLLEQIYPRLGKAKI
jgi:hypothetical protein